MPRCSPTSLTLHTRVVIPLLCTGLSTLLGAVQEASDALSSLDSVDSCPLPIYTQSGAVSDQTLDDISGGACSQLSFGAC